MIVTRYNLEIGRKVIDEDGNIGTITECDDLHNVFVQLDNDMGSGLYCFAENCEENSENYILKYIAGWSSGSSGGS